MLAAKAKTVYVLARGILAATPLAYVPVRVRKGPAKGARWTLLPFSANWRQGGGEQDVACALKYLKPVKGAVFWDFGAHFGIHTVGLAMQVGPVGQVVAFEPDPTAFARLHRHVTMNDLQNVKLFSAAASSRKGTEALYLPYGHQGWSLSHFKCYPENDMTGIPYVMVPTLVPDDLVAEGAIREPDLIKIDVQGHGAEVIAGSIKTVERRRPIIVFSNHSPAELEGTRRLLQPLGYRAVDLNGETVTWSDVSEAVLLPDMAGIDHNCQPVQSKPPFPPTLTVKPVRYPFAVR
jgi:FkbM family methyltransferase